MNYVAEYKESSNKVFILVLAGSSPVGHANLTRKENEHGETEPHLGGGISVQGRLLLATKSGLQSPAGRREEGKGSYGQGLRPCWTYSPRHQIHSTKGVRMSKKNHVWVVEERVERGRLPPTTRKWWPWACFDVKRVALGESKRLTKRWSSSGTVFRVTKYVPAKENE